MKRLARVLAHSFILAALCLSACSRIETADKREQPSVLLISIDTVRPDHIGAYGYARNTTPAIDGLARQGVVFARTWAQAPWTLPSHMSLFTSLLPSENTVDSINRAIPPQTPILAELLQSNGYVTAALVNNGQMKSHWGFNRGFSLWQEFKVDSPSGNCEHITAKAIDWLGGQRDRPFFLFLHYYDAHDPYDAPDKYKEMFKTSLTGEQAREITWQARSPSIQIRDEKTMQQVVASYDAEIARLDNQLQKLFNAVPADALIVVFSDHGEAFEEHGWMLHGASLYEEEIRAALIMRLPNGEHAGQTIDHPVQLLDVSPTILSICGIPAPTTFSGRDLSPLLNGHDIPKTIIESETKAVIEGRYLHSAISYPWKSIYSVLDGKEELYKLPDEQTNLHGQIQDTHADFQAVSALQSYTRSSISADFWMIHVRGNGKFEVLLDTVDDTFPVFIPVGFQHGRDAIELSRNKRLIWTVFPAGQTKSLYIETPASGEFMLDVLVEGKRQEESVFVGSRAITTSLLPVALHNTGGRPLTALCDDRPSTQGVYVHHYQQGGPRGPATDANIDDDTARQLRSLGYIR